MNKVRGLVSFPYQEVSGYGKDKDWICTDKEKYLQCAGRGKVCGSDKDKA
jgi:hypothetical protein